MATRYVRSTDGSNADNGTTWALAKADMVGVAAIDTAGDTIWLSDNHSETTVGSIVFALAGTPANPTRLLCGDDAAEPPTALATTAAVANISSGTTSINGSLYAYGITFTSYAGFSLTTTGSAKQVYENCSFVTFSGGVINAGAGTVSNNATKVEFNNCTFKFASVGGGVYAGGQVVVNGGSVLAGGANIVAFGTAGGDRSHTEFLVNGVDFSNCAAGFCLFVCDSTGSRHMVARNCKLPASWTGGVVYLSGVAIQVAQRYEMYNCDSGNTNYRMWVEDYSGNIKTETTIVRTSGASDGTTPISWKMATSANTAYPSTILESPEIAIWNDTTGASKTATIEFVHDTNVAAGQGAGTASAFRDDEVWLKVQYLGDSASPLSTFITDCKTDVLTTAADQASSSEAWTTTGMTTPVKQKLSVTFTPQKKGPIVATIVMAKASKTIYFDPLITIT